jgi:hypothetical protein
MSGPSGASVNLAERFKGEGAASKADLFSEDPEATMSEEWVEGDDQLSSCVPTVSQWNQLVKRVGVISQDLEDARLDLLSAELRLSRKITWRAWTIKLSTFVALSVNDLVTMISSA